MARLKRQRNPKKLDLAVSFKIRYGDEDEEQVVFLEDKPIKMVGNVFKYRDAALRYTSKALVKVALLQPMVAKKAAGATAKTTKAATRGARLGVRIGQSLRGRGGDTKASSAADKTARRAKKTSDRPPKKTR